MYLIMDLIFHWIFFIRVSDLIDWIKFFIPFFFVYSYHGTVGEQLHRSPELPILLLFSDIAVYSHDEHLFTVFVLRFASSETVSWTSIHRSVSFSKETVEQIKFKFAHQNILHERNKPFEKNVLFHRMEFLFKRFFFLKEFALGEFPLLRNFFSFRQLFLWK